MLLLKPFLSSEKNVFKAIEFACVDWLFVQTTAYCTKDYMGYYNCKLNKT